MKKFFLACVLAIAFTTASASPVSLDLREVSLNDFLRVVYGEIIKKPFYLDSPVITDKEVFTLSLKNSTPEQLEKEAKKILDMRGFSVREIQGVLTVTVKTKPEEQEGEIFVYRPLHRGVSYLMPLVKSLFKPGQFVSSSSPAGLQFGQVSGLYGSAAGFNPLGATHQNVLQNPSQFPAGVSAAPSDLGVNQLANNDQDLIVFRGTDKDIQKLQKVLAAVDVASGELLVKAVVFEVQTGGKQSSAVDLVSAFLKSKVGIRLEMGAADSPNVFVKSATAGADFTAVYSALSSDDRFKILSSPRVRVRSGASARFSVGNETPVIGSTSYDANGRATQSIEYKPSGVIFEIKPQIRAQTSDIKVSQTLSSFVPTTNGVNTSPTLLKRELTTDVVASDGDVIVLGGLDDETTSGAEIGISFLPRFLRAVTSSHKKTEVLLMLHVTKI